MWVPWLNFNFSQSFKPIFCSRLLDQRCRVRDGRQAPILPEFHQAPLPHCLQTSCFTASTLLALAAFWLLPCMVPFGCLIPASFPASLLALCLQSAGADTVGQFYHLPLSPISTVVAIVINHLPWHRFPWWLSSCLIFSLCDCYGEIRFSRITFQITLSDVTFKNCFHDLSVFFVISFSGCHQASENADTSFLSFSPLTFTFSSNYFWLLCHSTRQSRWVIALKILETILLFS